ncbi:MAG TPA: hypothetical protein VII34_02840 [Pyrinomonadaceae bacterium]
MQGEADGVTPAGFFSGRRQAAQGNGARAQVRTYAMDPMKEAAN